jgi:hypothetical protein
MDQAIFPFSLWAHVQDFVWYVLNGGYFELWVEEAIPVKVLDRNRVHRSDTGAGDLTRFTV